jgi:hypothetical protein
MRKYPILAAICRFVSQPLWLKMFVIASRKVKIFQNTRLTNGLT